MKLYYRVIGQGEPLFILHGLFGCSDNWNSIAKTLSTNFEVYTVDLRNHGLSPHSDIFNYDVMMQDLKELLDSINIKSASFIGHSMGGKVLMQFAYYHPEYISNLIVVDISPKYYKPHHSEVLEALNSIDFNYFDNRKKIEEQIFSKLQDIGVTLFLTINIYWKEIGLEGSSKLKLSWRFNLPILTKNIEEVGKESKFPHSESKFRSLFIAGRKSNYIDKKDVELILENYPNPKVEYIENAGHWVQAEQPQKFIEIINEFLLAN
jgi:pimeloyl-ACP methyl ester carboxylesterase